MVTEKRKANAQKNTLLKNAEAGAEGNYFKRVFFSPTQKEIQIIYFPLFGFLIIYFSNARCIIGRTSLLL
jgi:hypothetical protein